MGFFSSTCDPFDVTVSGDVSAAIERARRQVSAAGGTFTGDASGGKFSGTSPVGAIEGTYTGSGNVLTVTITSRPRVAPCGTIAERVRGFFG